MFNTLKPSPAVEGGAPAGAEIPTVTISVAAFEALTNAVPETSVLSTQIRSREETKAQINAAVSAIESFGLQRGFLAFANYDGVLESAVPALTALKALGEDISVEAAAEVVTALKAIDLGDVVEEGSLESVNSTIGAILTTTYTVALERLNLLKHLKLGAKKHELEVHALPAHKLMEYLHAAEKAAHISKEIGEAALPKTEEELHKFIEHLDHHIDDLKDLGIHGKDGHVVVTPLAMAEHKKVEELGYGEHTLTEIHAAAEKINAAIAHFDDPEHEERFETALDKIKNKEERHYAKKAWHMAYVAEVEIGHRIFRVLKLADKTVKEIKHLYEEKKD